MPFYLETNYPTTLIVVRKNSLSHLKFWVAILMFEYNIHFLYFDILVHKIDFYPVSAYTTPVFLRLGVNLSEKYHSYVLHLIIFLCVTSIVWSWLSITPKHAAKNKTDIKLTVVEILCFPSACSVNTLIFLLTLWQATKAQRGSRGIALLFL